LENYAIIDQDQATNIHHELDLLWQQSLAAIKTWEKSVRDFAPSAL